MVPRPARRGWKIVGPWILLCGCAALFVGSDVLERKLFPNLTTGWRHFLLTMRSAIATGIGSLIVYAHMRRQQNHLAAAAKQLSQLVENYRAHVNTRAHFDHALPSQCLDLVGCPRPDGPTDEFPEERRGNVVAAEVSSSCAASPRVCTKPSHESDDDKLSGSDGMTQLGESLNNLIVLLDEEAEQLRRIRAQMIERGKMAAIGQMAAGIAHEIGNPLSSISAVVQMLQRKERSVADRRQLDLIQGHIQRISSIVRQLASLANPAAERWELVDLGPVLDEAVHLISFDRRARRVRILFTPPVSLPRTYALKGQLQQVFINILLNALDALGDEGELTITAETSPRGMVFRFEDTGCGIPAETGRRVFEPFFTTKEPGHGTGLGLAVSYSIVQKHGGTIDFAPRNGGGTIFQVEIPVLNEAPDV